MPTRSDLAIIAFATCIPCGIHFAMGINSLRQFFVNDPLWDPPIDGARWGLFQSLMTAPNVLLPIVAGLFMDVFHSMRRGTAVALFLTMAGQWLFTWGVFERGFYLALCGRFVFGMGAGCVSLASGAIASKAFAAPQRRRVLPVALGITESFHALATVLSSSTPVLISERCGNYWSALAAGAVVCTFSFFVGLPGCCYRRARITERPRRLSDISDGLSPWESVDGIPRSFYLLLLIHFCFSGAHRLFGHIDSSYFYSQYHVGMRAAGYMSASTSVLGVVLPPLLGRLFLVKSCDVNTKLAALFIISVAFCGVFAYIALAMRLNPLAPLVVLSVTNAVSPTTLKILVGCTVPCSGLATAFGMFEAVESLAKTVGGILVGIVHDEAQTYVPDLFAFAWTLLVAFLAAVGYLFVHSPHSPKEPLAVPLLT